MIKTYTYFIQMNATKAWLSLSIEERNRFVSNTLQPIFQKYPHVNIRLYDAEAFTAHCSDIAIFETEKIEDYAKLMDNLRDSEIFTIPYFEIIDIIPAIEASHLD